MNIKKYDKIIFEARNIAINKNNDYGDETLKKFMQKGITVRLNDKNERLINLVWKKTEHKVKSEKIEDTAMDMINYCIYLIMMERGEL